MITVLPADGPASMQAFIRLPARLSRGDPAWVTPLTLERRQAVSPRSNPFFRHARAAFWLAEREGRVAGRISAQVDPRVPPGPSGPIGHFGLIAAEDDPAVFAALLATAESWLRARGVRQVQGPFNLSINEECGLLVDGFGTPPMLLMGHHPAHAAGHVAACGYTKAKDLLAYLYDLGREPPPALALLGRRLPDAVRLRMIDLKRYAAEIRTLCDIFNDAWSGNWGFLPLGQDEAAHLAAAMRPLIDRRLVWFAEVDGEPAGFIVALPNVNEAIRDLDGALLPFGWARLLWRLKVAGLRSARVPLMGVRRRYRTELTGRTLPFLLIEALRREGVALGLRSVELSWILEDNLPMRRIIEAAGATAYKTYRIYEKTLS